MKRSKLYFETVLLLITVMSITGSFAQTIDATIDRDKIFIGEQIRLKLKVFNVDANSKTLSAWFRVPDSLNHIEIVERGKIDTIEVNNNYTFEQTITLTSFDSGQWEIPILTATLTDKGSGKAFSSSTKPLEIEVLPVDVSQLKDYHDIKEIIEVEEKNSPVVIGILIAMTMLSAIALYKLAVSKKTAVVITSPLPAGNKSPLEWALEELDKLQNDNLPLHNQVKQHYQKLTDICRLYFYYQFHQGALQQTTDEWMIDIHPMEVDKNAKASFFQLLRLADTVKFAKYLPPAYDNDQSVSIAKAMLLQVAEVGKPILQTSKKNLL